MGTVTKLSTVCSINGCYHRTAIHLPMVFVWNDRIVCEDCFAELNGEYIDLTTLAASAVRTIARSIFT